MGTVLTKTFLLQGKRIETRLFMRHPNGTWAGYSYEWNDAETDAALLPGAKSKQVGNQTWHFPSRAQCMQCHTEAAGRALGPEIAQLNRDFRYPMGATRNQLAVLEGLGYLSAPLSSTPATLPKLAEPHGTAPVEERARAYLHGNCSGCHRPGAGRGMLDWRATTPLAETNSCDVAPAFGDWGLGNGARIVAPSSPASSVLSLRVHALDAARMPPVGSAVVDEPGATLLDAWVTGLTQCP